MHLDFKISEISGGFGKWRHRSVTPLSVITSDYFCYYCIKLQISFFLLSSVGKARLGTGRKPRRKCMSRKCNALVMSL